MNVVADLPALPSVVSSKRPFGFTEGAEEELVVKPVTRVGQACTSVRLELLGDGSSGANADPVTPKCRKVRSDPKALGQKEDY